MRVAYDGWHGLMLLTPRKLPMPDTGGRTSSVKLGCPCIRTLNYIFTFYLFYILLVFGVPHAAWYIGQGLGILDTREFY